VSRRESGTIAAIVAAVGLPLILAYVLVAADMRDDLSELKPAAVSGDAALIGWPDLNPGYDRPAQTRWPAGTRVRMLGYMMDGYRSVPEGAEAGMFILMPEAGHFLHPAHRIPEEMVEVRPVRPLAFQSRRLVWVWGLLGRVTREAKSGMPRREAALFAMSDAEVRPADNIEIARWFIP
jgi:hypothetical protein